MKTKVETNFEDSCATRGYTFDELYGKAREGFYRPIDKRGITSTARLVCIGPANNESRVVLYCRVNCNFAKASRVAWRSYTFTRVEDYKETINIELTS